MTKDELIARERQSLGGRGGRDHEIRVLDYAELAGETKVLIYETDSRPFEGKLLISTRYALYTPEGGGNGGVVSTRWVEVQK